LKQSLVLAAVLLAACAPSGTQKYLQKGDLYSSQGQYADAAIQYRKALQADPRSGAAYYRLGLVELKQKHFHEAYGALKQAATLLPDDDSVHSELAQLCLTSYLGDATRPKDLYNELASLADSMLARDSGSFDGLRLRGYLAMADSKPAVAVEYFRKANQAKPFQADVVTALVQNLLHEKQESEAESLALELIARQKEAIPIYDVLYFYYIDHDRQEKAEAILRQKIANNPGAPAFVVELCRNLHRRGKTGAATACVQQLAGFPQGPLLAADFYGEMGDWPEAIRGYRQAAERHPGILTPPPRSV
jgi:tetratricopeptide (TPR) repeat protein